MAAADLRAELSCSVCREIYTDPVTLLCGHNFCLICIERTWDSQKSIEEDPSCPECRRTYRKCPELERNLRLRNIAEQFLSDNMKCSAHNKILEFYCCEDYACVCVSCWQDGEHRGHRVKLLSEASEKKKEKLRKVLEKLRPEREETERGHVARVISRQKEKISHQLWDLKKEEVSRKTWPIEELCNMADPLTVLHERESDVFCVAEGRNNEDSEMEEIKVPLTGDLTTETLPRVITETFLNKCRIYVLEATDLLLDINTAHNRVSVSGDRKSASYSLTELHYPQSPERFQKYTQTLSSRSFPSGRHYWEVEVSESGFWRVGVAYPSIERRGSQSCIGYSDKSWCLYRWNNKYTVTHDIKDTELPHVSSCRRIRISLDYEAGRLSFYELSEPIRHLHTFTATFTEPLHVAFWVWEDSCVRIIS